MAMMRISDFLYHFTKIYFSEAVKDTILIENWEEKDFHHRYVEYLDVFTELSQQYLRNSISDIEIINKLSKDKVNLVAIFNETMRGSFRKELVKYPYGEEKVQEELGKLPFGDIINPNILEKFRELEENFSCNI